MISWRYN